MIKCLKNWNAAPIYVLIINTEEMSAILVAFSPFKYSQRLHLSSSSAFLKWWVMTHLMGCDLVSGGAHRTSDENSSYGMVQINDEMPLALRIFKYQITANCPAVCKLE